MSLSLALSLRSGRFESPLLPHFSKKSTPPSLLFFLFSHLVRAQKKITIESPAPSVRAAPSLRSVAIVGGYDILRP